MHTDACELLKEWNRERENTMCRKTEEEMRRKRVKFTSNRPKAGLVGYPNNREHELNEN